MALAIVRFALQTVMLAARVRELATLGERVEAYFGRPQDIEWVLADGHAPVVAPVAAGTV